MDAALTQLGVGGIFAVLVLKQVFDFVEKRKNGNVNGNGSAQHLKDQVNDLHVWHQPSSNGVQEWKNPRLVEAIDNLSENIKDNTLASRDLITEMRKRPCLMSKNKN